MNKYYLGYSPHIVEEHAHIYPFLWGFLFVGGWVDLRMKINEIHWFLKFVIGVAVGLTVGYFTDMNLGLLLGILLGTAFAQGTWKV